MEGTQQSTQSSDEDLSVLDNNNLIWSTLRSINQRLPNLDIISKEIVVGRNRKCEIVVTDQRISQIHFRIFKNVGNNKEVTAILEDMRFINLILIFN